MNKLILLLLCILPLHSLAETAKEKIKEDVQEIKQSAKKSSDRREERHHTALVGLEFFSTWVPTKVTASYTYNFNRKWSLEAEYARGYMGTGIIGVDLASISENRYSFQARRFLGNSFHTIFGLYKDDVKAKLGSEFLDDMTDTSIDSLSVQVVGATLGLGNRWQWGSGFTLGIDWIRMSLPLIDKNIDDDVLKNIPSESDRDKIKSGIDKVTDVPTFVLFGFYLGYSF